MPPHLNQKFAESLVSLTLVRAGLAVQSEPRGDETLFHVYKQVPRALQEAEFFVRVQYFDTAEDAKAAREHKLTGSLYGKAVYLAQVIGDDAMAVSSGLKQHMKYSKKDIKNLETF